MTFDSGHLIPGCLITDVRLPDTWRQYQFQTPDSKTYDSKTCDSKTNSGHLIPRLVIPKLIPDIWFQDLWFQNQFQTSDFKTCDSKNQFWTLDSRHIISTHFITKTILGTWTIKGILRFEGCNCKPSNGNPDVTMILENKIFWISNIRTNN